MNREEQKPEDLLEREIKKEIEDFVAEVKEEPLFGDYHKQILPKFEEFLDPCLPLTSQNAYLNNIQSFQVISNESNISQKSFRQNIYQESNVVSESTFEPGVAVSNSPVSKKTSIFEPRIAKFLNNENTQSLTFNDIYMKRNNIRTRGEPYSIPQNFVTEQCAVCKHRRNSEYCKSVTLGEDKLIIIVGCRLCGNYNLVNQKLFMVDSRKTAPVSVCNVHFYEVYNEICKALFINPAEIASNCFVSIDILMPIVNDLNPFISPWEFRTILSDFIWRNRKLIETSAPIRLNFGGYQKPSGFHRIETKTKALDGYFKQTTLTVQQFSVQSRHMPKTIQPLIMRKHDGCLVKNPQSARCSVCLQLQQCHLLTSLSHDSHKLLIMVGCILHGEYTLEEAKLVLNLDKRDLICFSHYIKTIYEIYKALNIKKLHELDSCSFDSIQRVMNIMKSLCTQYPTPDLRSILQCFVFSMNECLKRRE